MSDVSLAPGAVVCIRLKSTPRHDASESHGPGLRSLTMAEAKWCQEVADATHHHYQLVLSISSRGTDSVHTIYQRRGRWP